MRPRLVDALDGKTETGFLLGVRGRLYAVGESLDVCHVGPEFAIGSGAPYALGALSASGARTPRGRAMAAMRAAAEHCASVAAPLEIIDG